MTTKALCGRILSGLILSTSSAFADFGDAGYYIGGGAYGGAARNWQDAANWQDGRIPGRYSGKNDQGQTATLGSVGETAYFGGLNKSGDWLFLPTGSYPVSISNVVFTGNNFPGQFGQADWQCLTIEEGGGLYVNDSCTKSEIKFVGAIRPYTVSRATTFTFWNDSASTVLNLSAGFTAVAQATTSFATASFLFGGAGRIQLGGSMPANSGFFTDVQLAFSAGGLTISGADFHGTKGIYARAGYEKQVLTIAKGANCKLGDSNRGSQQITVRSDLEIVGDGTLQLWSSESADGSLLANPIMSFVNGKSLTIATTLKNRFNGGGWGTEGLGTLRITGENLMSGNALLNRTTFETTTLGDAGESSPFGTGSRITFQNGGGIRFVGDSAAETDRELVLGLNGGCLDQAGTGRLTFGGTIRANGGNGILLLTNETAAVAEVSGPIVDDGIYTVPVHKRGEGEWILSGTNTTTADTHVYGGKLTIGVEGAHAKSKISLDKVGATLSLAGDGTPRAKEIKKLDGYSRNTVLEIGAGVVLTAKELSLVDAAQIDVRADAASGARLIVPGKKGRVANVTLNGRPAAFRNGVLVERGGLVILLR